MKALRRSGLIGITLLLTVLLVACGETAMQGTPANTANQSMNNQNAMNNKTDSGMMNTTPTATSNMNTNNNGNMNNNNNNMMGGITITPGMGGNMGAFIHTGVATINGNKVNVLMTNKGFAVYYYRADTMFKATCTGQCAQRLASYPGSSRNDGGFQFYDSAQAVVSTPDILMERRCSMMATHCIPMRRICSLVLLQAALRICYGTWLV